MLKVMFGGRVGAGNLGVNQRERGACCLAVPLLVLSSCVEQTPLNMTPPRREWCVKHGLGK